VPSALPIICAFDDSDESRHALRAATWLAHGLGAPLVLTHVLDLLSIPTLPSDELLRLSITDQDLEEQARGAAHRLLATGAQTATDVELTTELLEGHPAPEIARLASERRAALLVAGTAARKGLDRFLVGSVASELAAGAPCPLVAVPRGAALEDPGPVLAGYDGSEHSLRAARHAAALAARLGRELVLLHVAGRDEGVRPDAELARELHGAGVRGLGEDPDRPPLDLKVSLAVEEGDPVKALAGAARERAAALIVTGTRGRNALSKALLGSVSVGLVRDAGRPVVLVPSRAGNEPPAS
jgi:nucleotide-binding universal stress UspA family protein